LWAAKITKPGQENDGAERFGRLEQWSRERFPQMGEVKYRWSGQVMEPIDGLAFIGRNPLDDDNVFIATGDSGPGNDSRNHRRNVAV
jgi:glycine/D-amino acid oxidase-like deaminating enzyme